MGECLFWYRPTRVVPDQRPLNGCCCCCCCNAFLSRIVADDVVDNAVVIAIDDDDDDTLTADAKKTKVEGTCCPVRKPKEKLFAKIKLQTISSS